LPASRPTHDGNAAIDADVNQYVITWGARRFRHAIAAKVARTYSGWKVDPERELTVTCGTTEGMIASLLALVNPGDEVVIYEPWSCPAVVDTLVRADRFSTTSATPEERHEGSTNRAPAGSSRPSDSK
jgi:bifunctional pyridoxal-dependent enzyme with beta-cystathionase and maltose regulon repressor activities